MPEPGERSLWGRFKQRFSNAKLRLASYLNETRVIYAAFALGDGLSNASSVIKYAAETTGRGMLPADRMHLWLMTPFGIAIAAIETVFLTAFSVLGSYFSETDKNPIKRKLAKSWPYIRDAIKGGKGAYKAVRSVLFMCLLFGAAAVPGLLLPLGIFFGICSIINRSWRRTMVNARKKMEVDNEALIKSKTLTLDDLNSIKRQSQWIRCKGFLSAIYAGLFDGLYLYAGVYVLAMLSPPLALMVMIFSLFYVVLSVTRAVFEEYCYQIKTEISADKAALAIYNAISTESLTQEDLKNMQQCQNRLRKNQKLTYGTALGEAVRNGLSGYSAITGLLFAVSLFTPIPLALLLTAVALGAALLFGFMTHHIWFVYRHHQVKHTLNQIPDDFEIARSFASGLRQGPKETNLVLNALQEQDKAGHYRESKPMVIVMIVVACAQSVIFALKALAKGFGRTKTEVKTETMVPGSPLTVASSDETLGSPSMRHSPSQDNRFFNPPEEPPNTARDSTPVNYIT